MARKARVRTPDLTGLDGSTRPRDTFMTVGTKPPKVRFRPGSFIELEGRIYEVMYAYRVEKDPHEWRYVLEDRDGLRRVVPTDPWAQLAIQSGVGELTPRIVYDLFEDDGEAHIYFAGIPRWKNRRVVLNKQMVQSAKLLSSGEVLPPEEGLPPEDLDSLPLLNPGK